MAAAASAASWTHHAAPARVSPSRVPSSPGPARRPRSRATGGRIRPAAPTATNDHQAIHHPRRRPLEGGAGPGPEGLRGLAPLGRRGDAAAQDRGRDHRGRQHHEPQQADRGQQHQQPRQHGQRAGAVAHRRWARARPRPRADGDRSSGGMPVLREDAPGDARGARGAQRRHDGPRVAGIAAGGPRHQRARRPCGPRGAGTPSPRAPRAPGAPRRAAARPPPGPRARGRRRGPRGPRSRRARGRATVAGARRRR